MQYDAQNEYWGPGSSPSEAYPHQTPVQSRTSNMYPSGQFLIHGHLPHHVSETLGQQTPHTSSPFLQPSHTSSQHPAQTRSGPYPPPRQNYHPSQTSGQYSPHAQTPHPSSHAQNLHSQQLRYPLHATGPYPSQSPGSFLEPPRQSTQHPSQTSSAYPPGSFIQPPHESTQHPSQTSSAYPPGSFLQVPRESTQRPSQTSDRYTAHVSALHMHSPYVPPLHPSQLPGWYPSQTSGSLAQPLHTTNQYPSYPPASTQYPAQSHHIYFQQTHANGASQHPHQGQSQPFIDPGFAPTGSAQRRQPVDHQTGQRHASTAPTAPHFPPDAVPWDTPTRANIACSQPTSRNRSLNPHRLPKSASGHGVPQPEVPEDSHPLPNASTGPTRPTSVNAAQSRGEDASAKPSQPDPQTELRNPVLPDGQGDGDVASKHQRRFVPPLDLGPNATYEEVMSLWEKLSTEDHETVAQMWREMEQAWHDEVNKMDVDPPHLFSIGSSEPKLKSKQDPKSRRKRANSRCPPTQTPTSTPSAPPAAASSTDPANAAWPRTFKTVQVEDYVSDSERKDDADDVVPIPAHLKGKGRAIDEEREFPLSPEHQIPTLNVRPDPPARNSNHSSPFSAILNAFHVMGERMEHLETSVTRGLKEVDDKIAGLADGPTSAKAPVNPLGHKSKGPKAAVAKLLATRNGTNTIPPPTYVHPQSSSTPITFPAPMPPPFEENGRSHPASAQTTRGSSGARQNTQYPIATPVPPTANAEHPGVPGAQHPTPVVHPGYPHGYSGNQDIRYSMPTQVPPVRTSAGRPHSTSTQVDVDLSPEDIDSLNKLCRKYVRRHLWGELLRIKDPTQLHERCLPLTDAEFEQYMRIKERVINAENFRIDFTRGWGRCAFNAEARSFFACHFVLSVRGGMYQNPPLPAHWITEPVIEKVLDKVMVHVTHQYNEQSKAPTVHQQAKELRDMERKRANTRRDTASLFKWRLKTLVKLRLDHHLVLFADIEAAHLSSDKPAFGTDDRQSQFKLYYIIEAAWQSRDFKKFVHALDQWYLYHSRPKVGTKQHGGNLPCVREALPKGKVQIADTIALHGLWRNCYDEDWLKNLKVSEREDLNIRNEDYDFTLPPPPPIPAEFLARRGTSASTSTPRSTEAGEAAGPSTSPFNTTHSPATTSHTPPVAPNPAIHPIHNSSTVPPVSPESTVSGSGHTGSGCVVPSPIH